MKKIMICLLAALAVVSACNKTSTTTTPATGPFAGCFYHDFLYIYPGGTIDTTHITYISDDSLSFTIHNGNTYIYCFKFRSDSVSERIYKNSLSALTHYGTIHLNSGWHSISEFLYKQATGTLNSSATATYNSDGRTLVQISDYQTYLNNYVNTYDANGNKQYTILSFTGGSSYRDSFAYQYDPVKTSKMVYGYPYAGWYGTPDKNLVTKITRYSTPTDTVKSYSDYTYTLDADGYVTQRNTHTVYAGSGSVSDYIEKFSNRQCR